MQRRKQFTGALFFVFLLACLLTGLAGITRVPVRAAPRMQATACVGTTITQWTFLGDVITPSTGNGTYTVGSGLPATTFAAGSPDRAVSYNNWPATFDPSAYVQLAVSTIGRSSIGISFDYRASAGGPSNLDLHYSIDGTNFVPIGSPITLVRDAAFHSLTFSLTTVTGLDNNPNAAFRIYGYSPGGAAGTLRLDNITLTGNCLFPSNTDTPSATSSPTNTPSPTNTAPTATLGTPFPARALLINEVAWMGTIASTADEWIELYNPGTTPIDLTRWRLQSTDLSPDIQLSGTIPAGGYYLLERTDNTTVSDITADLIYSGELNNTGEILRLIDPAGGVVDTANSNGGAWPGGSSATFGSMERRGVIPDSDTAWITNTGVKRNGLDSNNNPINGTPKNLNWAVSVTPTASLTPTRTRTPTLVPTITRTPTPLPPPPLLIINEFVPRPGHDWNGDGAVNEGDEYIEILNHGVVDVNLSGHTLDDEVNIGSPPYILPAITLKPGERMAFFESETGLRLSDGGDGVRLLKPNGQLFDAYNYRVVYRPDHAYCRYPDNGGADDWHTDCFPTPGRQNSLSGSVAPPPEEETVESACPFADTQPEDYPFLLAECQSFGQNIFRPAFWDRTGWYGERYLPDSPGKWPVFAD